MTDTPGAQRPPGCAVCGRPAEADPVPLDWSLEAGPGGVRAVCPRCTREHVRSIEGKLDAEYW